MSRVLRWVAAPVVTAAAAFLFLAYAQSDDLPGVDQLSNELGVQNHCAFHSLQLSREFVVYATAAAPGCFLAGVCTKGTEIVIAFTGTNTTLDEHLHTNILAGVGVSTEQVRRALLLTL